MKLQSIVIEKFLPTVDQNVINAFFSLAYADPDFDGPYFQKVTVGVRYYGDISVNELRERALNKLHRVLGMSVPAPEHLQALLGQDHFGSPPAVQ
jgi:hypothetical protein